MQRVGRVAALGWLLAAFLVMWLVAAAASGTPAAGPVPRITVGPGLNG
jgi:hypothetical protein